MNRISLTLTRYDLKRKIQLFLHCMFSRCYSFEDAKQFIIVAAMYGSHARTEYCPICMFWHVEDRDVSKK